MNQTAIDTGLNTLKNYLLYLLDDELGVYEHTKNPDITIPSIYVSPPELDRDQWRMIPRSGIECVISRRPDIRINSMVGANEIKLQYKIDLRQHDPKKCTTVSCLKICNSKLFEVFETPIFTPFAESSSGNVLERCTLKVDVTYRQELK